MSNQTVWAHSEEHTIHVLQHKIFLHEQRIDDLLKTIASLNDVITLLVGAHDNPRKTLNAFRDILDNYDNKVKEAADVIEKEIEKELRKKRGRPTASKNKSKAKRRKKNV